MNAPEQPPACSACGAPLRAANAPAPCYRRTQIPVLLLVLEAGTAVALFEAALRGNASLHSNGLHVSKLAYDDIAFTILGVCILSCTLATVLLARVAKSWNRAEALGLLAGVVLGWLAASAFANASGRVTLNGASSEWVSWPAMLWLLVLMVIFAVLACDVRHGRGSTHVW
jgi:hypothetical protein